MCSAVARVGSGPAQRPGSILDDRRRRTRSPKSAGDVAPRRDVASRRGSMSESPSRIDGGDGPRATARARSLRSVRLQPMPCARSGLRYTCRNATRGSGRKLSGWAASHACELGVGGRGGVDGVLDQELELLAEPSPDDRVVAIEAQGHGFARRDLLADEARRSAPFSSCSVGGRCHGAGEAGDECVDLARRDDDAVRPRAPHRPATGKTAKSSAPIARNWTSGSRHRGQGSPPQAHDERVPARQGPVRRSRKGPGGYSSAVRGGLASTSRLARRRHGVYQIGEVYARSVHRHPGARQRRHAEALRVVGGPARGRDLDDAGVVERALLGVEAPDRSTPRSARARRWCWSRSRSPRPRCCRRTAACHPRRASGHRAQATS